jgi:hypothetical protein
MPLLTNFHRPDVVNNRHGDTVPDPVQDYWIHMGSVDKVNRTAVKVACPPSQELSLGSVLLLVCPGPLRL